MNTFKVPKKWVKSSKILILGLIFWGFITGINRVCILKCNTWTDSMSCFSVFPKIPRNLN